MFHCWNHISVIIFFPFGWKTHVAHAENYCTLDLLDHTLLLYCRILILSDGSQSFLFKLGVRWGFPAGLYVNIPKCMVRHLEVLLKLMLVPVTARVSPVLLQEVVRDHTIYYYLYCIIITCIHFSWVTVCLTTHKFTPNFKCIVSLVNSC